MTNQELEQVKEKQEQIVKYKSFEDINPTYAYIFANWESMKQETRMNAAEVICGNSARCVLGEAYSGPSWNNSCDECHTYGHEYGGGFPSVFRFKPMGGNNYDVGIDWAKFETLKENYVRHINEKHPDIGNELPRIV
jgi:hypothetical protein